MMEALSVSKAEHGFSDDTVNFLLDVNYKIAFNDGQSDILNKIVNRFIAELEEMKRAAEIFYQHLIKIVPESGIIEHRIGWDYASDEPATLTIISRKYDSKMAEILDMASSCEIDIYDKYEYDCYFWVITDEKIDRSLIEHDFPGIREGVANANIR
ncbi:MAG: hypothetical protein LBU70_06190 [Chitinispirillales bacterium]|jgi:cell division protein ZapA (FtsZ GTPase activity inhibitor)|nr:hypothetical protein [Chitinispirillales bacterium]